MHRMRACCAATRGYREVWITHRLAKATMATMKIVIINQHHTDVLGGSEIQCHIIASQLVRYGHEIVYLAAAAKQTTYAAPYPVIALRSFSLFNLYSVLRDIAPDVIYWRHNKKGLLICASVAKLLGIKFVYAMSHVSDSRPWVRSGNRPFERFLHALRTARNARPPLKSLALLVDPAVSATNYAAIPLFVDAVVCQVSELVDILPVRKQVVVPNSMPLEAAEFTWPRPYVVWVASIKAKKNPEKYRELARALKGRLNVDFLMVGAIQDKKYQYLARAEKTGDNFYYLGPKPLSEVNGILKNCLFLVHTCNPEGFPNNMIQAWLQGKPTISLYYDPESFIEQHHIGFHSRSFDKFVHDVRTLIDDKELRDEMGARAAAFAREYFDPGKNVRRLEELMLSLRT
jgi:glycosyltransferase involved in cell wall biosynthesis